MSDTPKPPESVVSAILGSAGKGWSLLRTVVGKAANGLGQPDLGNRISPKPEHKPPEVHLEQSAFPTADGKTQTLMMPTLRNRADESLDAVSVTVSVSHPSEKQPRRMRKDARIKKQYVRYSIDRIAPGLHSLHAECVENCMEVYAGASDTPVSIETFLSSNWQTLLYPVNHDDDSYCDYIALGREPWQIDIDYEYQTSSSSVRMKKSKRATIAPNYDSKRRLKVKPGKSECSWVIDY